MEKQKHTPGPWFVNGTAEIHTRDAWQKPICITFNNDVKAGSVSAAEAEANSRLIAAAPELLAYAECSAAVACEQVEGTRSYDSKPVLRSHGWNGEENIGVFLARIRRDAVTKATGQYLKLA